MMLSGNIQVSNYSDQCGPTYFIVLVEMSASTQKNRNRVAFLNSDAVCHCRVSPYTSAILLKMFRLRDYQ